MKTDKPISIKQWLRKSESKAASSALGFLQAHRNFLETGNLAPITTPILKMVDDGLLFPTPALEQLQAEVLAYMIKAEAEQANAKMAEGSSEAHTPTKAYTAFVYDSKGTIVTYIDSKGKEKEIIKNFDLPQDALRFLDRRLVEQSSDCYGVMQSNKIMIEGELQSEVVMRQDALSRILKAKKSPFSKKTGSDGKLTWQMRVRESHSTFSRG